MGKSVSRNCLTAMKNLNDPFWFSIIADEATYVFNTKQFTCRFSGFVITVKLMRILFLSFEFHKLIQKLQFLL